MSVSQGMQRDSVLAVAGQLDTDHQKVSDLMARAQACVSALGANWLGNDSTQFASDWAGQSKQLQLAGDALAAMSKTARTQATDQQATSTN